MEEEKKSKLEEYIGIPKGIKVDATEGEIKIKGSEGEITKRLLNPKIKIKVEDNKIIIGGLKNSKREKKIIGTFKAHIKNMMKGCKKPYKHTLKICSGHFPMNVSLNNDELIVKNFLGEKTPRVLKLKKNINVKVEGDQVIVESIDKKLAGQTAADIEKLCKITNRDPRIFQDGIWIINKAGKEIK